MTQLLDGPSAPANPLATDTDERLMAMIQDHKSTGLALLYDRYKTLVKAMSIKVLHNEADADDLLQDVFMEIWDRASSYDPQMGKPLAWIATLTRRRAIDRLRKRDVYSRVEDRFAEESKCNYECWTHVHEDLSLNEISVHVQRALATLPDAQQSAIRLAYHEQMTQREIAAHTGIPLGTIKTRLELGLRKLAVTMRGLECLL